MQSIGLSQRTLSSPLPSVHDGIDICSPELGNIISYPEFSAEEYSRRLDEICSFGITHFLPAGRTRIGKMIIAGKGCVSIVLKVRAKGKKICALKIRRTDANRPSMNREAHLHGIANCAGVGPFLFQSSENIITMEFIDGLSIVNWVEKHDDAAADEVTNLAVSILEQCYRLDTARIDHGQLSCINHHIIVSSKSNKNIANIVDFESSSTQRKPSNVTAAAQSLFLGGSISNQMKQLIQLPQREKIIELLKTYKSNPNRINFDNIVGMLR